LFQEKIIICFDIVTIIFCFCFFIVEHSTAINPIEFCTNIEQQDFPPKPVKRESDGSGTSASQNTGRQTFDPDINLNETIYFDLNENPPDE